MAVKRACGPAASTPVRVPRRGGCCATIVGSAHSLPPVVSLSGLDVVLQCRCHSISRRSLLPIVESTGGNVEEVGDGGGKKQNGGDRCDLV